MTGNIMKNEIVITVSGAAGTGKSTIVAMLEHHFEYYGLEVKVQSNDRCKTSLGQINTVIENSNITIVEQQTPRKTS
jgi:uridine kinase